MKSLFSLSLLAISAMLASCAGPTRYVANPDPGLGTYGYSEVQEDSTRWEVTFAGNFQTAPETVEQYALYRAAELTHEHGFDYFVVLHTGHATMLERRKHEPLIMKLIRMGHGPVPQKNANAYMAEEMLKTMAPSIQRGD